MCFGMLCNSQKTTLKPHLKQNKTKQNILHIFIIKIISLLIWYIVDQMSLTNGKKSLCSKIHLSL